MPHKFDVSKAENLESSERVQFLPAYKILAESGLRSGMIMADIGCGSGYFSLPAAEIVGEQGQVWALDISETMLDRLRAKMLPSQVIVRKIEENSFPIPEATIDYVLLAFVLHEAEQPPVFLNEVKRIMKTGTRLVLIDHEKKQEEKGPPVADRIDRKDAKALLSQSGFIIKKTTSLNSSHYQIIALKKKQGD